MSSKIRETFFGALPALLFGIQVAAPLGLNNPAWATSSEGLPPSFYIDAKYNQRALDKVDALIAKRLYSKQLAQTAWKDGAKKNHEAIINSKTLRDLGKSMGAAIGELKSSHCNFVTINDEMYHFLHALFSDFNKKLSKGKIDYVGFVAGGAPFEDNQVRYILDGSPASKAGLQIGDRILTVNGHTYVGYSNFIDTAGKNITFSIERNGESKSIVIKPEKEDIYTAYIDAMRKSAKVETTGTKKIGYIHVWSGGRRSFEALDDILESKLGTTDGLIFDLRDGYGGNSLDDLDRFYRSPKAYPDFQTIDRNGKKHTSRYYYDKPIVAIINGGSRSGKELLSYSFKQTGRAKLVGTKTAGAVLAGSLFKVDDKASLYLAVLDGTLDGVRLEGVGVAPDVVIDNATRDQVGYDKQLSAARETLVEQLK
ncbi:MAG: S41 family peptidase [Candidatus Melainabacteria bacterium]|nr:S41 family peptidase [Candidatus Melainabacteria bacterium]